MTASADVGQLVPIEDQPDYAGTWVDEGTGRTNVMMAGDRPVAAKAGVNVIRVRHSLAELRSLNDKAFDELAESSISYTAVDVRNNRVRVGLTDYSDDLARSVANRFGADRVDVVKADRYNVAVQKIERSKTTTLADARPGTAAVGVCNDGIYCSPTRGGVYLEQASGQYVYRCTSTAVGRDRNGANSTLTAGHCFSDASQDVWIGTTSPDIGGHRLGKPTIRNFGPADALSIRWSNANGGGADRLTNCNYLNGGNQCHRIHYNAALSDLWIGRALTKRGITTGETAGAITANDANVNMGDGHGGTVPLRHMIIARTCTLPGDSGGVAVVGDRLAGTISGGNFRLDGNGNPVCDPNPTVVVSPGTSAYYEIGFLPHLND